MDVDETFNETVPEEMVEKVTENEGDCCEKISPTVTNISVENILIDFQHNEVGKSFSVEDCRKSLTCSRVISS